jgi:cysteinyl-tRNA synthetase
MIPADHYPKATESIPKMIRMIEILLEKEYAYREDDGSVYFNIRSFPDYGRLSKINIAAQHSTDRVSKDEYDKDEPRDFALWKSWKPNDGDVSWDAPWGKGRPGWHIECSAMSVEALGNNFDVHCGGVDNMFPHHENEIAQSQCATDETFVNYWLHSEHLMVEGGKMSKSIGNYYRISDLKKLGFSPECIRYQLLSGHYRSKINFSVNKRHEGDRVVRRISDFHNRLVENNSEEFSMGKFPEASAQFKEKMNDDLDTPKSLAVFFDWMKTINTKLDQDEITEKELGESWEFLFLFDSVFGLLKKPDKEAPKDILKLADRRMEAREQKDWALSDAVRDELRSKGWIVDDTPNGQKLKKA